jgi:hypothetical protein
MAVPDTDQPAARTPAPWWRRRRVWLAIAVFLLVAIRVALPPILRSQIEKQANAALLGHATVGDVDLWILRGAVALKDVALRGENAAPDDPPLAAFRRFYVNIGWWGLLRHRLRIEDVGLDGLELNVDRLKTGALVLPSLRPKPETEPPPEKPAEQPAKAGTPWDVIVDQAYFGDGHFRLRDHIVEPPEKREVDLDGLRLTHFELLAQPHGRPGKGLIEVKFGDGTVRIETGVQSRPDGFAVSALVSIKKLPLDRLQVHMPELGWSDFAGRLDANVALRAEPKKTPQLTGTIALRDLSVSVASVPEPVLAWKRLAVDVDTLDVVARKARVKEVVLEGGRVIIQPHEPAPLPFVPPRRESPAGTPPPAEPASPPSPWSWSVGKVEVTDTVAKVFLEPPPLEVTLVKATVTGLSSTRGSMATVAVEVRPETGTIALDGTVGIDPLAAQLTVRLDGLALGRLVAATGAAPVLLPGGTLGGELKIAAEHEPLVVSGNLAIADLAVTRLDGKDFALGWKRLDLAVHELRVPGALPSPTPAPPGPIIVDIEKLALDGPTVSLTRTADGLVLPGSAPAGAAAPASPPATAAAPSATAPPSPPGETPPKPAAREVKLSLAKLDLDGGDVAVVDRTVKPFYQGHVSAIALHASGLHYPEGTFDDFTFNARVPGNAPLSFKGKRGPRGIDLEANGERIPLPQANPYVAQAAGYSIAKGTTTFSSKVRWGTDTYTSQTRIKFDDLDLAGAEGDSLFAQRFGLPLTLAIALMKDVHGVIDFNVPVSGDRKGGAKVDLGAIVAQALTKAILGAVTSPLKLLGAVAMSGDKVEGFAPEPIAFLPGKAELADDGWPRVGQLANVLASYPAIRFTLRGNAGPTDVRALEEAAVLADLNADKGVFKSIQNLASLRERNDLRDYLTARVAGKPAELSPDRQPALEKWIAEHPASDADLAALAKARAEKLRALLTKDYGVAAEKVAAGEPDVNRTDGKPAVTVALGAGR